MNPDEITLDTISKSFEYEKHSRFVDELDGSELKNYAKSICKLYLKQQEIISQLSFSIGSIEQ